MEMSLKPLPAFIDEVEERTFWESRDSTDYVDWTKARNTSFPKLRRTRNSDLIVE
jgi:hypothetical protein